MEKTFLILLLFIPATLIADYLHVAPSIVFLLSAAAIIPLAKYIGEATEEITARTSPAFGGFLNATFGNATELIIGFFAIQAGLVSVVKASITGSIIGNLLLVLGTAMLAGGLKHKKQKFNKTSAMEASSTMLLAVIALVMPAIFAQAAPLAGGGRVTDLSIFVSIVMLAVYGASLLFSLRTHRHLYEDEIVELESKWSVWKSLLILALATAAVAWMSGILVGSIAPAIHTLGWTPLFIGVVLIAIVGNAAEHTSAIVTAVKNRMDLALHIAIGSATQIAIFVAPVLVLFSLLFKAQMSLVFNAFELISIVLSVLITNLVIQDGESNWLEGLQLLMAYAIMAVAFFLHP